MAENTYSKTKLKPAKKYVSMDKSNEMKENAEETTPSVPSSNNQSGSVVTDVELNENDDIVVPDCQTDSKPVDKSQGVEVAKEFTDSQLGDMSVRDFCVLLETAMNTLLDNRNKAHEQAEKERNEKKKAAGITLYTLEEVSLKCMGFIEAIYKDYNLYLEHRNSIARQQDRVESTVEKQKQLSNSLGTIIGRIEKVQGVKAPRRPPFPSWACLAYLFWHWPMYGFSYLWLSKYFRRFCFLITFFVLILEFCLIVLLAGDNRTYNHERGKYNIVRNWSYVMEDTAAMNRFNKVDLLFENVEFNHEKIESLDSMIQSKHEKMRKKRRK